MAERLNDVYNNPKYTDNTFIIRSLNTILPNNSSKMIYDQLTHFTELFTELLQVSQIKRPDVKFIVENINVIQNNNTFDKFKKMLSTIIYQDFNTYKYLFLMCYCRTLFEIFYENKIRYTKPEYAIKQALGDEPWNIFLDAFKKDEYVYLP
jgi:hypothetical protein